MSDWKKDAVCATVDPELFYPEPYEHGKRAQAKAICAVCPVKVECLEYALDVGDKFGIMGGLTNLERETIRGTSAGRRRTKCKNGHPFEGNAVKMGVRWVCQPCKEERRLARAAG